MSRAVFQGSVALAALVMLAACSSPGRAPSGLTQVSAPAATVIPRDPGLGSPPVVHAAAYIVVDPRNGHVLLEHNAQVRRPVASTQKLLTALVVLESGGMDEWVTVSASDTAVEPAKMGIKAGDRYRRRDLLEAMLVRSCNDIAACLARTTAGSESAFVARMNAKAAALGMRNSHFATPHGLDKPGQYSTAFDLAILAAAALNRADLHRITETREMVFKMADGQSAYIMNTNKVLRMSPYCTGLKTGYTSGAGRCLVSSGERGLKRAVVVVLGSQIPDVWNDSKELLDWALQVPVSPPPAG
jgi:serine-type D-Ala-D-Ala carboxypeptidase (penicillin-binding protein 5/6)